MHLLVPTMSRIFKLEAIRSKQILPRKMGDFRDNLVQKQLEAKRQLNNSKRRLGVNMSGMIKSYNFIYVAIGRLFVNDEKYSSSTVSMQ